MVTSTSMAPVITSCATSAALASPRSIPPSVTKRDLMPFMMAYGELRDLVSKLPVDKGGVMTAVRQQLLVCSLQ